MDLWNNEIGRRFAQQSDNKEELATKLYQGLSNGKLTTIDVVRYTNRHIFHYSTQCFCCCTLQSIDHPSTRNIAHLDKLGSLH
jgi:hypothetical protein